MNTLIIIRAASDADAQSVAELVQSVGHYFLADPSGAGAEGFLSSISAAAISGYISNPAFNYLVAFMGQDLAGVAAIKENKHIYHLFVRPDCHRQGVAHLLWQHLKDHAIAAGNPGMFTVNSSLYAVPVYARFGFVPTSEPQTKNGIQFQPMHLNAGPTTRSSATSLPSAEPCLG